MRRPDPEQGTAAPDQAPPGAAPPTDVPGPSGSRYGWFVGVVAVLVLILITVNTISTKPNGSAGIPAGGKMPPFAVPLALGRLSGDADVATRPNEGPAGRRPACTLRAPGILNVCQLYEQGPVVLALFVARDGCPGVLDDMQRLSGQYPGLQFAAVALRGDRGHLRALITQHRWTFPVGYDRDGVSLANLYKLATCPQVTFARPGGVVVGKALLIRPSVAVLRQRLDGLVAASKANGWRSPA